MDYVRYLFNYWINSINNSLIMNKDINKQLQTVIGNLIGKDYFKLKIGEYIYVEDKDGEFSYREPEKHLIKGFMYPEWNDIVPSFIETCCGTYKPTSRNDGYWGNDMKLGGWDYYGQEPTLNDVLLAIGDKNVEVGGMWIPRKIHILNIYDLKKSLFSQSKETKLAIIKLLE